MRLLVLAVWLSGTVLLGAGNALPVTALACSPSGQEVLIGNQAGLIVLPWHQIGDRSDSPSDPAHAWLRKIDEPVHGIQFAPGRQKLAISGGTAGEWGTLWILDWAARKILHVKLDHDDTIMAMAWSPDGRLLATASLDGTAILYQADTMEVKHRIRGHSKGLLGVEFVDGDHLVTASRDATMRLWSVPQAEPIRTLKNHTDEVIAVQTMSAESGGRPSIVSISVDRSIRFWQPTIGRMMRFARIPDEYPLSLQWVPKTRQVIVVGSQGSIFSVNPEDAKMQRLHRFEDRLLSLAIHPATATLIAGGFSGNLYKIE